MILLAIGLLGGASAAAGAIVVTCLTIDEVLAWFRARRHLLRDPDAVAATVLETLANGQFRTVQGIFNHRTGKWAEQRTIDSERIDTQLSTRHRHATFATYRV
jgi:hypothetical protein